MNKNRKAIRAPQRSGTKNSGGRYSSVTIWLSHSICCTVYKHKRARRIRIAIAPDGRVTVTRPPWVSTRSAVAFAETRQHWIEQKRAQCACIDPNITDRTDAHFARYKEQARALVHDKVAYWNRRYGFPVGRIAIKRQRALGKLFLAG